MPRADTGLDLWALPLDRPAAAASITADRGSEESGAFSPDGRWLAFTADRGGRAEVVVASVEATQSEMRLGKVRIPVSTEGGSRARWRADGKEMFFKGLDGRLYAVPVKPAGSGLVFGTPVPLFRGPNLTDWDVMPDGQQFVVVDEPYAAAQTLRVLTNWTARLKP